MLDSPSDANREPPASDPPILVGRIVAVFEVLLCSGYPTQVALGKTFQALGYGPFTSAGDLATAYVVGVSLADALLVVGLVLLFLVSTASVRATWLSEAGRSRWAWRR